MMKKSKMEKLKAVLRKMGSVVVAYSGGLDSTFLLKAAFDTLGRNNVLAVTARSETYPAGEYAESVKVAGFIGAVQTTILTEELGIKKYKDNPVDRCYFCKKELFKKMEDIRQKKGYLYVIDGANQDDLKDVRHGMRAAKELFVRSPLIEAGITKKEIRKVSKKLKLPTWDKPSLACLASRIPFNNAINGKRLKQIEMAEDSLRRLGFKQVRVRHYDHTARIEVFPDEFRLAIRCRSTILKRLKSAGFTYICLDLAGYRTGSMHEFNPGI